MGRCGCSDVCNCVVEAGTGTTVTGAGSANNPYIVSAVAQPIVIADTPCINLSGTGIAGDPLTATPIIGAEPNGLSCLPGGLTVAPSTDAGNAITIGTDGNLMATGVAGVPLVSDTPSVNMTVTGSTISADVITGCGLEIGAGVQANVAAWPFACPQDANAQDVYCSPGTGQLQTAPEKFTESAFTPVGALAVVNTQPANCPGPTVVFNEASAMVFTNPDPCRPMVVNLEFGGRVRLDVENDLMLTNLNAFTVNALTFYQVNGGGMILARNDTYNHESGLNNQTTAAGHVFESTPAPVIIPPGGAITIDTQMQYTCSGAVDGTQIQITRNGPSIRATGWSQ